MKRKILASFLLLVLIFTNYVYAGYTSFRREGGYRLNTFATVFSDKIYVDSKTNAKTITPESIEIYDSSNNRINIDYNNKDSFMKSTDTNGVTYGFYRIKLEPNSKHSTQTIFRLKNGIQYNGEKYNVKLVVGQIRVDGGVKNETIQPEFRVRVANVSDPTKKTTPLLYMVPTEGGKAEVDIDYYIYKVVNGQEQSVKIDGVLELNDIDLNQGIAIENFELNKDNCFVKTNTTGNIKYTTGGGTYIYTLSDKNIVADDSENCDAYLRMEDFNHARFVLTFESKNAGSHIRFAEAESLYVQYNKITTAVEGGTIKEENSKNIAKIKNGEERNIVYSPNNKDTQYLKSVTVDNKEVATNTYPSNYKFNNITANHSIKVVYADKLRVTFDSNGGTEVNPNIQYVIPDNKATKPADPTRTGYKFAGWQEKGTTNIFDIANTKITKNTDLVAKWTPEQYKINYVTDGGENSPSNPPTYTVNNVVDFKDPTKDGYEFKGWYTDSKFTTPIYGIPLGSTGDKTIYAKWEKKQNPDLPKTALYTIEYYTQKPNGTYEKYSSTPLSGEVGKTVTIPEITINGYKENMNNSNRVISGTVKEDGTLVLKRYYDISETPAPEPKTANYTIEYYTQKSDGTYQKSKTMQLTDEVGKTVTIPEETIDGYKENMNNSDRVISGTVKEDGSLVLRRYYDIAEKEPETATYTLEYYKQKNDGTYEITKTSYLEGTIGSTVTIPEATYDGFKENTAHENRLISGKVTEDGTLILKRYYDKIAYKVTFDPQNNTTIPDQTVPYAEKATKPSDPQKEGYTFRYWYYLDENNQPIVYDFETPVSKNIDLIARWEENKTDTPTPKQDDPVVPKKDETITEKVLPKTGIIGTTLISVLVIAIAGLIYAIRYRKLKDIK